MEKVFISYSRKDIEFARKLAGDLGKAGYDVWWDITDLRGGDDWVRVIPEAIAASRFVIVVLTSDSAESEWVRKEYTQALNLRKKIIPIMLTSTSVPFALNTLNYVNFMSGEYEDNFKNLLSPLGFTGKPPEVKPFNWRTVVLLSVFRKYAIPIVIIIILLLAFKWNSIFEPPQVTIPTYTATISPTPTAVLSRETATATPEIPTPTSLRTFTPTRPIPTSTPTLPQQYSLPI
ncbi:MAG TPA: TIR domain-containing protein, partial [Anaerolineales bacterium]|nr:TIR domain-containing protein [Anaerolineales bacterium]